MIFGKMSLGIFLLVLVFLYACEGFPDPNHDDSCEGDPCGENASCEKDEKGVPVCSCPVNMKGDPFVACTPVTDDDVCQDDSCGESAECEPGEEDGVKLPVCSCPAGYGGDPFEKCEKED